MPVNPAQAYFDTQEGLYAFFFLDVQIILPFFLPPSI